MNRAALLVTALVGGCVYFNAMYDANREFDAGEKALQEQSEVQARVKFDSVIAKTGRILEGHPTSKYADDAAILKARSELYTRKWESAAETSRTAAALSDDERTAALAQGLGAVALRQLGKTAEADSLLGFALGFDLDPDDRALFLFERGLARQELGMAELAAADLEEASDARALSPEGRLTLSVALRDMGDYPRSAEMTSPLLAGSPVDLSSPLYVHLDSLTVLDPESIDTVAASLLYERDITPTRAAALLYLRGRATMRDGDTVQALAYLDEAVQRASTGTAAADAAYWATRARLRLARQPADVIQLIEPLGTARRSTSPEVRAEATRLQRAAQTFERLMGAHAGRGATAAEALLRAAELTRVDLDAPAVARGLYLQYVREAPQSRWVAKAIVGALSVSGHVPDPGWVLDDGLSTDEELRRRLVALPADDPYRLILTDPDSRDAVADSAYVLAEADLLRRLDEIRRLFDATAVDTVPIVSDSIAPADDEVEF